MKYITKYATPLGEATLASDDERLIGFWFDGQKYDRDALIGEEICEKTTPVLIAARRWLDVYFSGKNPASPPPVVVEGS
jgi:methylated-DNA-[protein]-cysteine S-methyltransferase